MITVSPGSTRLTKHASMPAEPVPLIGSVSALSVRNDGAQPVADLVEHREELGIEVPEHRPLERFHHLGIRVRRARARATTDRRAATDRRLPSAIGARMRYAAWNSARQGRRCQPRPSTCSASSMPGWSPTTMPRASCAAARAHARDVVVGQVDVGALRDRLHLRRRGERGRRRVVQPVRAPQRLLDHEHRPGCSRPRRPSTRARRADRPRSSGCRRRSARPAPVRRPRCPHCLSRQSRPVE